MRLCCAACCRRRALDAPAMWVTIHPDPSLPPRSGVDADSPRGPIRFGARPAMSFQDPAVDPVICSPFEEPAHHWLLDRTGRAMSGAARAPRVDAVESSGRRRQVRTD